MTAPLHQRIFHWVLWILAGIAACGVLLDAVANALSLVTLPVAAGVSVLVIVAWGLVEGAVRLYSPQWRGRDGSVQRIKNLGAQPRLGIVGVLLLLWIPAAIDWLRHRDARPAPPMNESTFAPAAKDGVAPTEKPNVQTKEEKRSPPTPPPPKSSAQEKKPAAGNAAQHPAPTQTMINSPGGIQAGGNVTITSDRHIIHSMTVRTSIELHTAPTAPHETRSDFGLHSILAFFTADKTRIRFATDFIVQDQQVSEEKRRLTFTYTPETPEQILGKPLEYLATIEVLGVNYAELLQMKRIDATASEATVECVITVNGVRVSGITMKSPPGTLAKGQATFKVSAAFANIPAEYEKAVARR